MQRLHMLPSQGSRCHHACEEERNKRLSTCRIGQQPGFAVSLQQQQPHFRELSAIAQSNRHTHHSMMNHFPQDVQHIWRAHSQAHRAISYRQPSRLEPTAAAGRWSTMGTSSAASTHISETTPETVATLASWELQCGHHTSCKRHNNQPIPQHAGNRQRQQQQHSIALSMGLARTRLAGSQLHTAKHVSSKPSRGHQTSCKRHNNRPGQQQAGQYPDKQREVEPMPPVQDTNH